MSDFTEYDEKRLSQCKKKREGQSGYPYVQRSSEEMTLIRKKADSDMEQRVIRRREEKREEREERDKRDRDDLEEHYREERRLERLREEARRKVYG